MKVSVSLTEHNNGNIITIEPKGSIDAETLPKFEQELDKIVANGNYNIIIDLGGVNYISSSGWGIFINHIKEIRENGGDLKLVNMINEVYDIFVKLEFYHILKTYSAINEAIKDFGSFGG